ncbi:MAG: sulfatase-like hydrolase/transferase, partial [Planctomycetota bacterium]
MRTCWATPASFGGGKHEQYEGGVRVPFIIRWPGHVSPGRVDNRSVLSGLDWLPTLCSIVGID